jgi:hypothetical protein
MLGNEVDRGTSVSSNTDHTNLVPLEQRSECATDCRVVINEQNRQRISE